MGKGDKKTRRGKIILGTYGVRRPRKKTKKAELKQIQPVSDNGMKGRRPVKERKVEKEVAESKVVSEIIEVQEIKEKKQEVIQEVKDLKSEVSGLKELWKNMNLSLLLQKKRIKTEKKVKEPIPAKRLRSQNCQKTKLMKISVKVENLQKLQKLKKK